ncbi:MAG: hypothetical protein P9M08_11525 [Candidatus Erginobacter occultus]|nr:hypothetical protein [Candidatus Erginobacter occultus]
MPGKKPIVLHPLFFALFPVLFLFSHNRGEALAPVQVLMPLAFSLLAALLLWGLVSLVWKNRRKSALAVSLAVVLFFSYGHFHNALTGVTVAGLNLWQHRYLLGAYGIILLLAVFWTVRTRKKLDKLTAILNLVSVTLVAISLLNISIHAIRRAGPVRPPEEAAVGETFSAPAAGGDLPDIYYIILDAYAHEETLKEIYGYDNSEFINFLEEKGFYVAARGRSNYPFSAPSISSSLNFEYLDYLRGRDGDNPEISVAFYYLIENNKAVQFLKSRGYKFVHFDSGWSGNERNRHADLQLRYGYGNEFAVVLAQTTLLLPFRRVLNLLAGDHRKRILGIFAGIAEVHRTVPGPKFVFAHLVCPHGPYVFGPQGEEREVDMVSLTRPGRHRAYLDQVQFVNLKVEELLEVLLAPSERLPVVIIQGDHGPISVGGFKDPSDRFLRERMRILNAYFLPDNGKDLLYPTITPVNTFRLIFNLYLGQDFPLLPDRSYYRGNSTSYDFYDVTDRVTFSPEAD